VPTPNRLAKVGAVIGFVARCAVESFSWSAPLAFDANAVEQFLGLRAFVHLAGRHLHTDRLAGPFTQHMDFRRQAAATFS